MLFNNQSTFPIMGILKTPTPSHCFKKAFKEGGVKNQP